VNHLIFTPLVLLIGSIVISGCSTNRVERENKTDQLETMVKNSRLVFHRKQQHLFRTEANYINHMMAENRTHASYPLYLCENASFYLLLGEQPKARLCLEEACKLQDVLFDKTKEKQALSIWGNESDKVYKGEPFERAVLYLLYGTCLLNDGDLENALACFKRSLLMDADSSDVQFHSDFPLPMILAAKCYDYQNKTEERDMYLHNAVDAVLTRYSRDGQNSLMERMTADLRLAKEKREITPYLRILLSWGNMDSHVFDGVFSQEERAWLKTMVPSNPEMDFNTVVFLWNGRGPWFSLSGDNNHQRNVNVMPIPKVGGKDVNYQFSYGDKEETAPAFDVLGDISYQAITQGRRKMEAFQNDKSNTKDAMSDVGEVLASPTLASIPYIGLASMAIGYSLAEMSKGINAEADIRSWQCLPREFTVAFLKLPSGESAVELQVLVGQRILPQRRVVSIKRHENSPLQVVHLFPTN